MKLNGPVEETISQLRLLEGLHGKIEKVADTFFEDARKRDSFNEDTNKIVIGVPSDEIISSTCNILNEYCELFIPEFGIDDEDEYDLLEQINEFKDDLLKVSNKGLLSYDELQWARSTIDMFLKERDIIYNYLNLISRDHISDGETIFTDFDVPQEYVNQLQSELNTVVTKGIIKFEKDISEGGRIILLGDSDKAKLANNIYDIIKKYLNSEPWKKRALTRKWIVYIKNEKIKYIPVNKLSDAACGN